MTRSGNAKFWNSGGSAPTIRLLGPFSAAGCDGAALQLPKKAQALLCYMVANRERAIPRDEAATLLWSNTNSVQSRQSLRQSFSVLRSLLAPASSHLKSDRQFIRLSKDHRFEIDLVTFEQAAKANAPEELAIADAVYRDDLLLGLNLEDEPFGDWLTLERQRLSLARINVIDRLARLRAENDDLVTAIDLARRLLTLDRYREESIRLLMELLAISDQRGLAIVEHARAQRLLRHDLGLSPDPTTQALAERIRRGVTTIAPVSSAGTSGRPPIKSTGDRHSSSPKRSPFGAARPQVIVFPFNNLTGSHRHDGMAHAIGQDVSIAISGDRSIDVLFADDNLRTKWRTCSDAAEDSYAVSGTLRGDHGRVRIVAQLISQSTGRLLWSGRFDDTLETASRQDRISSQVAARVSYAIRYNELERTRRAPTERLSALQLCLRAAATMRQGKAGNRIARDLLRDLLARNPEYGMAHALSARCFHVQRMMGWLSPDDPNLAEGVQHANEAMVLSGDDPEALWLASLAILNIDGDPERGRRLVEKSLAVNPNAPNAWIAASFISCQSGDAATALDYVREAELLNPFDISHHVQQNAAATAHFIAGNYKAASVASDACLAVRPGYTAALRIKVATLSLLGRSDKAEVAARELRFLEPEASVSRMRDYWKCVASNAPHALDAKIDGWRRAGMPE